MIDEEFAFVGPALFDLGMFLANLVFALIRHHLLDNVRTKKQLWAAIPAAVDAYCAQCREMREKEELVRDTCGFMAVELIRRYAYGK